MIVGDPSVIAIESGIMQAYERLSAYALGFFTIHVGGRRYGIPDPDATLMACSFDEVERRIAERGKHTAPFSCEPDAGKIADAFRDAVYAMEPEENHFGIVRSEFTKLFSGPNGVAWAPDGDEAFDDSSYILQFDVEDRVRLIAFQPLEDGSHDPATLRDVWLGSDEFYGILQRWRDAFESEWASLPKAPNDDIPYTMLDVRDEFRGDAPVADGG